MAVNILIAAAIAYLYCNSGNAPDKRTKKTETGLEVHRPVDRRTGVETLYRASGIEKKIIKELMDLDGMTFPEDYESRLFTLSRGSIDTNALSEDEQDKVNQIFNAIKSHMIEFFKGKDTFNLEEARGDGIEAVYIYSFSHKAATLECLTSNDLCQPANTQHITFKGKPTAQSNNEDSIFDNYKNMFLSEWILEQSKASLKGYRETDPGYYLSGADFTQKKSLHEACLGFIEASRVVEKNKAFPTAGFRAVFIMTDPAKKDLYIQTAGRSYTHKFGAERLSNMLKTIPGKQISMLTGLAKKLHTKKQP
ncbi:hypothetical protein [Endozoicomonas sp. ALD040]|uniref:hypothetical protein n=1 Tax=Endozoicomonas sp. ALD040 TaxID=3403079 RepID=UPI003BAEF6B7